MARKKIGSKRKPGVHPTLTGLTDFLDVFNDKMKDEVVQKFIEYFYRSRNFRTTWHDDWITYYQQYRSYSPFYKSLPNWKSQIYVPKSFEIIETILPRMMGAFFDTHPVMAAVAEKQEYAGLSANVEELFDTRAWQMDLFFKQYTTFKEMLIYGTAFQKVEYRNTQEYQGPMIVPKDIFDIYPAPYGIDMVDTRYIIERSMRHIYELEYMKDQGLIKSLDGITKDGGSRYFSHFDRLRSIGYGDNSSSGTEGYHECLEYWGEYQHEETDEIFDVRAMIVDRQHLVFMSENPYLFADENDEFFYGLKPYIKYQDVPVPHEFYGIGECEVMQDLQREVNDTKNAIGDALQFAVSPSFTIQTGTIDPRNKDKFVVAPGKMNEVQIPDGIKPFESSLQWMAGYDFMDRSKQEARDATGIQHTLSGNEGNIRKTASETILLRDESMQRIKMKNMLSARNMSAAAIMVVAMDIQFTDEKIPVMKFGMKGASEYGQISPADLKWRGKFTIEPSALFGSKAIKAQYRMQFLDLVSKNEALGKMVNMHELLRRLAESMDIDPNNLIEEMSQARREPQLTMIKGGAGQFGRPATSLPPPAEAEMAAIAEASPGPVGGERDIMNRLNVQVA